MGQRFVEQVQRRRLHQQGGDSQALTFAAGEGVDLPLLHAVEPDGGQRATCQPGVVGRFPVPAAKVWVTAGEHRFEYRRTERIVMELPQPGATQGGLARRHQVRVFAVEQHGAAGGLAKAGERR